MCSRVVLYFILIISTEIAAQKTSFNGNVLVKLDSINRMCGDEKYFAGLYYHTTILAEEYIKSLQITEQPMMKKLEQGFAGYFISAVEANYLGENIPAVWKNYLSGLSLSPVQLQLPGANAHINGDIWQAMHSAFSAEELKMMKPVYRRYNQSLDQIFSGLYSEIYASEKKLRLLHKLSFGLDKYYGRWMLHHWRNRQLNLAISSFENEKKINRLYQRTTNKKNEMDRLIIRRLH